jgi:myo-inositol-1(or 4)-monophosphatase
MGHDVAALREHAEYLVAEVGVSTGRDRKSAIRRRWTAATRDRGDDNVGDLCRGVEWAIRTSLGHRRPGDAVSGPHQDEPARPGEVRWLVDPLGGRTNADRGIPLHAVSVAAQVDGVTVAAAVAEPATGRLWSAGLGEGSALLDPRAENGWADLEMEDKWADLRVATTTDLSRVVLAAGCSPDPAERAFQDDTLARLTHRITDVRRTGSAALDLCWVAAGSLDVFLARDLPERDWAAGALIAEEAGAVVRVPTAADPTTRRPEHVLVAAPGVADDFRDLLFQTYAAVLRAGFDLPGPPTATA